MLERIFQFANANPTKVALSYKGNVLVYNELVEKILYFSKVNIGTNEGVLINSNNPLESIPLFLGITLANKKAIFSSNQLLIEQKETLLNEFRLIDSSSLQFDLLNTYSLKKESKVLFLGVLTSGTTASPKVIWKDWQSWESAFRYQTEIFNISTDDTLFVLDALGYSANLNAVLHHLWQGGSVHFGSLQQANDWANELERNSVTCTFLVPSHLQLLFNQSVTKCFNFKSIITAGEKLASQLAKNILENCKDVTLTEYYGAAELGHITYHQNEDIIHYPATVGKPFPGVDLSIVENKIVVKSNYVSPEYRNINSVNDLGYLEKGRLILLGRADRMFNRRGLNVFAEEIENVVLQLDGIEAAIAISKKINENNDEIWLCYTLKPLANSQKRFTKADIRTYLLKKLPPAKRPRRLVELTTFPRMSNGKIDFLLLNKILSTASKSSDSQLAV